MPGSIRAKTPITREVPFLSANSDISMTVLRLLAECGRVSRRTFDMLPYSYRNTCVYIKKLVDSKSVRLSGVGDSKSYILLDGGRKILSANHPQRYTPELSDLNKLLTRHPERSRLRGDVAAAMSLAGFAVHPDDKPTLPASTPQPPDHQYTGLRYLFSNTQPHQYGQIIPNQDVYLKHLTPIGCYYDSIQLKNSRGALDVSGVNYSRACGVLITPSSLFRVYHSRDVAMRFHKTGEENLSALIASAFTGYMPDDNSGILVFGQGWLAATSILDIYLRDKMIAPTKNSDIPGEILGTTNLGKPLYYLPMRSESLQLLRLMRFPDWRKSLMHFAAASHAGLKQTDWHYLHEGRRVFTVADLNLTNLAIILRGVMKNPREPVTLLCLNWQQEFILSLVQEYGGDKANALIILLPDSFMDGLTGNLKSHWGG